MFAFIYYFLCVIAYVLMLPFLFATSFKAKHRKSIPARFFCKDFLQPCVCEYWFHACSLGEMKSLEPILKELKNKNILLTCITHTGFNQAKKFADELNSNIIVKYLPFEIFLPVFASKIQGLKTLIITEAEMWYMLVRVAKKLDAKIMLINARISNKSLSNYQRFSTLYKRILKLIDIVLAQSSEDVKRLKNLGAQNVLHFGNLKMLSKISTSKQYKKPHSLVITAASTHNGEEELILNAFKSFKSKHSNSLLILAPRHPERFEKIFNLAIENGFKVQKFSKIISEYIESSDEIILLDTMGDLVNIYAISDIVILGGGFAKVGGHNPLEPAFFHTKLLSGEHIFNQLALFELVENAYIIKPNELLAKLNDFQSLKPSSIVAKSDSKLDELLNLIQSSKA